MKLRSVLWMRVAKYGYILVSVVFCLAGLALLLLPTPTASAVGIFLGVTLLVFGMIKLIGYFSKDLFRLAFQYDLQFGSLLMILGIITLIRHQNALDFICTAYGISMIADGLFKVKTAFEARRFGIGQWWLTLVFAILSGVAGILIMTWPTVAVQTVKLLLGLSLLVEGILSLSVAVSMIKIIDHQRPDVLEAEYELQEDD